MGYLVAAYTAVWCILFFYLYTLKSRLNSVEAKIEELSKKTGLSA